MNHIEVFTVLIKVLGIECCTLGSAEHLVAVLSTAGMHVDKQYVDTTPPIVIIRIYKFSVVRSILNADVDINLKVIKAHRVMSPP
jgi:hypothetical protein